MSRIVFFVLTCVLATSHVTKSQNRKPNVIVILADDLGFGDLACYGNTKVQTPNLDKLATNGVRFTQNYAAAPICAPSRAALLTGKYNHRLGALSVESNRGLDRIDLQTKTMADLFKEGGYETCMVGKWHNGLFDQKHHPNYRGFDDFFGFLNGGIDYYKWILNHNGEDVYADGSYITDVFTEHAVKYVEKNRDKPFFCFLHSMHRMIPYKHRKTKWQNIWAEVILIKPLVLCML